jgi:hypothetical protein
MEPATEVKLSSLKEISWHFIHDDGTIYYITSETRMSSVEELVGLKPDGTSVLKEFLNRIKIGVFSLTMNEKFAVDSTKIPVINEIIEDSVLYSPGQQYASCIDCCVLCDVKTKCPSCYRRVLVARILRQPATSSGSVVESSDMEISDNITILPDIFNGGSSASLQKPERQDEDLSDSEIKVTENKKSQILSIDSDSETTFSEPEDLNSTAALPGPSNVKDMFPPAASRIFNKPPAALPGPSNVMDTFPPEACRIFDNPSANKSRTRVNPPNTSIWIPRHTFCS